MRHVFFLIAVFFVLFTSCSKDDINDSFVDSNYTNSRLPDEFDDIIVDSIYAVFSVGHNEVGDIIIDIYPDNFPSDPIETEIYLGEKNRELGHITLPNGTQLKNCPEAGNNCGNVYWRGDEPTSDPRWQFIGYY